MRHCAAEVLCDTVQRKSCATLCSGSPVRHCAAEVLCDTVQRKSCATLCSGSPVRHCAAEVLCDTVQRKSCATLCLLNDGSVWRIEEFIFQSFTQLTHEQYHDRFVETQAWLSPSAKSVWHFTFSLFFFFLFYICLLQKCNIIPQCCKEKHPFNAWNTLSPELLELVGSRKTFFFGPNYFFFSPSRVAFGVLM